MSYVNDSTRTFPVSGAIAKYLRVKISGGVVVLAGLADQHVGTTENTVQSTDTVATVRMSNACGTVKMVASKAIAAGAAVYSVASGQVSDTQASTAYQVGIAISAAGAAGDVIEVLPLLGDTPKP